MRIVYFGNADFGIPTLNALLNSSNDELLGIVTNKDKKSGRGQVNTKTSIKSWAIKNNILIINKKSLDESSFINYLRDLNPDIFIVIAYKLLPFELFKIPKYGAMNLHASLLPKYRGSAPIQHAILNGESETGITTFIINKKIDKGNIILQKRIKINKNDNFETIYNKLSRIGASLAIDSLNHIKNNKPLIEQIGKSSYAKKIKGEDLQINWSLSDIDIINIIRAFSPHPGAFTFLKNKRIKIFNAEKTKIKKINMQPGQIFMDNTSLYVNTTKNLVKINKLQIEGKKKMNAFDFINGYLANIKDLLKFENR